MLRVIPKYTSYTFAVHDDEENSEYSYTKRFHSRERNTSGPQAIPRDSRKYVGSSITVTTGSHRFGLFGRVR
jgi:hypothetical protein